MPRNVIVRCYQAFPARYTLVILGFLGFCILYAMRVNLSVAMVAMVNTTKQASENTVACRSLVKIGSNQTNGDLVKNKGEFNWNSQTQGLILGSFFYGYVITQLPGGLASQKIGGKWLYGIGVLVTTVFTLLTPLAARIGVWALVGARFMEGLGEGVTFPAMYFLVGHWIPKMERSRLITIIHMGSPVGTMMAMAIAGLLTASSGGWPSVFYVFGTLGCIWFIFWSVLIYDTPASNPRITQEEIELIQEGRDNIVVGKAPIPWKSLLKSCPVWALVITHFGQNWGFITLMTEMPTYLANVLHFDQRKNGILSALPYLMQSIISLVASFIADKLRAGGKLKITTIRKICNSIAFYGPGICVLGVAFAGCRPVITIVLLTLSMGFNGFMNSGFNVTHVDMSPEFAATLMGITNCVSNMTGFLAPAYTSWMIEGGQTLRNWSIVFITATSVYFITGSIYNIFASAELQPWGLSSNHPDRNTEKNKSKLLSSKGTIQ